MEVTLKPYVSYKHTAFEQIFILRMRVAVSTYWFYDQPELEKSEAVS